MIHSLSLTLSLPLRPKHIYDFRGAFIDMLIEHKLPQDIIEIFSNKSDDGTQQGKPIEQYPMVQFRSIDGIATLWAVNEGVTALKKVIKSAVLNNFNINGQDYPLEIIKEVDRETLDIGFSKEMDFHYHVKQLLPLNEPKSNEYKNTSSYVSKIKLIEKIILNELVLLTYALKLKNPPEIKVEITDVISKSKSPYRTKNKNERIQIDEYTFNIKFRTNMELPNEISISRHKSCGYGILYRIE